MELYEMTHGGITYTVELHGKRVVKTYRKYDTTQAPLKPWLHEFLVRHLWLALGEEAQHHAA